MNQGGHRNHVNHKQMLTSQNEEILPQRRRQQRKWEYTKQGKKKARQARNCGATESRRKIETVMVPGDQRNTELKSVDDVNWREGEQQLSRVTGRRRGPGRR